MPEAKVKKKPVKKKRKLNLKKHSSLVIMGVIGALLLVNIFVLSLLPARVKGIIQTRSETLAQQLQNQSAQKVISDINAAEQEKEILDSVLPTKNMLLQVIELFESLNSITKVQSFSFETENPRQDVFGYSYMPVSLILEGSLSQNMATLEKLKQTPYLFSIINTQIESPNGLSEEVIVRTTVNLYVRQPFQEN